MAKSNKKRIKGIQNKYDNAKRSYILKKIKGIKGQRFTGAFQCPLCGHTRTMGYFYETDIEEYEICKYCYDTLHDVRPHVKVLYTPMGSKR